MGSKQYFVYIMSNTSKTLYIGVTNDIDRRLYEHRNMIADGFTKRYHITKLVYFEIFSDVKQAISRETVLKGWLRKKKVALIASMNPKWEDLSKQWARQNESFVQTESSDSSLRSE
jgi:putative endonuclease